MNESILQMLQKTPLWAGADSQDLSLVVRMAKENNFESGKVIVHKGEPGDGFYLILEGEVEVKSDGKTLTKLGPGQFFGEMAIFDNQPRSADVVAIKQSRVLFLSAPAFKTFLMTNPKVGMKMLGEFARRLRNTSKALTE